MMRRHFITYLHSAFYLLPTLIACSHPSELMLQEPAPPAPPVNAPTSVAHQAFGVRGSGTLKDGTVISNIDVDQGSLIGINQTTGQPVRGVDFVLARIPIRYDDGREATAYVSDWKLPTTPSGTLEYYNIITEDGTSICGNDQSAAPLFVTPLSEVFDLKTGREISEPSLYTFACYGGAIARCLELGYRKWASVDETYDSATRPRPLSSYHAACVAMIRADYCGDGQAHTIDRTTIGFYDTLRIGIDFTIGTSDPMWGPWTDEAEWTQDGAFCIEHTRFMAADGRALEDNQSAAHNPHWAYILEHCPQRIAGNSLAGAPLRPCGAQSSFYPAQGFDADQSQRSLIKNTSPLYRY